MNCAYCERPAAATREHVWPSCFLDRFGRAAAKFSVRAQKVHGADYVVADVCEQCNGGSLSEVDSYFCQLYDAYLHQLHDFGATIIFKYDYRLLLRSLLKISYNSARSGGSTTKPFLQCRSFILGRADPPAEVALFLELVAPSMWPDKNNPAVLRKVPPNVYRAAISRFTKPGGEKLLSRLVAVNSFYFHLHLPIAEMERGEFEKITNDFGESIKGLVRLTYDSASVEVRTSPQDGLQSMLPHLTGHQDQYAKYFKRRRSK